MQINVLSPQQQTLIFTAIFILTLVVSARKRNSSVYFSPSTTNELKGLAILMVVFSHIGYFLSVNREFLFPLSVFAGVGVNLFLFLSGFGLTTSSIKHPLSLMNFYKKRLLKVFFPMWIVLLFLFLLDWLILGKTYTVGTVVSSFLGWFPSVQIYSDINSPLWYFSWTLFYYLIFPVVTLKKLIYFSPLIIFLISYFLVNLKLPIEESLLKLYQLHLWAFPLGMVLALAIKANLFEKMGILFSKPRRSWFVYPTLILLVWVISYTAIHSGVGEGPKKEQFVSLITTGAFVGTFLLKPFRFKSLTFLGIYSYEIYLIHWPILYRYDLLYKTLPPFLATFIYLVFFVGLGLLIDKLTRTVYQKITNHIYYRYAKSCFNKTR